LVFRAGGLEIDQAKSGIPFLFPNWLENLASGVPGIHMELNKREGKFSNLSRNLPQDYEGK
jgi:hypothetical protein